MLRSGVSRRGVVLRDVLGGGAGVPLPVLRRALDAACLPEPLLSVARAMGARLLAASDDAGRRLRVGPPAVKYRGIFINDEMWGIRPWASHSVRTAGPHANMIATPNP